MAESGPESPEEARITLVGEFSDPRDLGITSSFWERVLRLTAGSADHRMVRPMAVAATSDGKVIFVADPDAQCVHRYDLGKRQYRCLGAKSNSEDIRPIGIAIVDDEWMVVSDSQSGLLYQAAITDKYLRAFVVSEDLSRPTGMFWNSRLQRLFVTDTGQQSVFEFDREGNLEGRIGGRGTEPGKFNYPTNIWMDSQNELLVTDSLNFRVQRFDGEGQFILSFGEIGDRPGDFSRPKGVATDGFGHVYVIDSLMHSMQIFNRQGDLLLALGVQGQREGDFWLPNGIFITLDNTIFVADSYNRRVQVFRYIGPEL